MKKFLTAVILFLAVMAFCSAALAAEITITTVPETITSAGSVDIKINIVNDSSETMSEISCVGHGINNPSQLYSQTLPAGRPLPITIKSVGISEDMLGVPQTYAFTWLEGTTRKSKDVTFTFGSAPAQTTAAMTATRTLSKDSGKEGDKITLTYTLKNPSTVPMTEVTVKDTIAGTNNIASPFTLQPGVSQNVTYEYTLGKEDVSSKPTITYKVNGATKTLEIASVTIKISNVSLQASVSQTEPSIDGTTFTIVLSNQGNQDISKITVTDELGVKVNEEAFTLKAGEDRTLTHVVVAEALRNVYFTISGTDASGQPYENRTKSSETRPYVDPESIKFTMFVTVVEPLSESGRMKVRFAIQNDSTVEISNATITETELGVLETREILESGETIIEKELRISEPRELQFTLSAFDLSGTERTYQAQVPAAYMPSATVDPQEQNTTEEPPEEASPNGLGGDTLITVLIVLAALMGVAGIALLALSIYERKKSKEMPDYDSDDILSEPVKKQKQEIKSEVKPRPARNAPHRSVITEDKYETPYRRPADIQEDPRRTFSQKQQPRQSVRTEPPKPQYTEPPARPQYTEPLRPQYTEPPARPQYVEPPVRPQYTEPPARPQYTEPPRPQYTEPPVRPKYTEPPARPQYTEPERFGVPPKTTEDIPPARPKNTGVRNRVHRVKPLDDDNTNPY